MGVELEKSLLITFHYFDLFDYPLKKEEIFRYLFATHTFGHQEINGGLSVLEKRAKIERSGDFYFLFGRRELLKKRREREQLAVNKIKKARVVSRVFSLLPGILMVAVCSNLGYLNADNESDIDFFIVTKRGRIWTARFWSVFLMKVFRQRPSPNGSRNKVCLSYFADEDSLGFEKTKIGDNDIHLVYLTAQHLLIYSDGGLWKKFIRENNWIKYYLPNFIYQQEAEKFMIGEGRGYLKRFFERIFFILPESWYRKIQYKIMPKRLIAAANKEDKKVIISDKILKLHLNDKREEIRNQVFNNKINA